MRSVGVPLTDVAVNAVTEPWFLYVSRFSGSVIVNVAPGANVSAFANVACLPANS